MSPSPFSAQGSEPDWLQPRTEGQADYQFVKNQLKVKLKQRARLGKSYAKRGAGLLVYGAVWAVGLLLVLPAVLGLSIGAAVLAQPLLLLPLLLILLGFAWMLRTANKKAKALLSEPMQPLFAGQGGQGEGDLRRLWQQYGAALPDLPHAALAGTIRSVREAFYLTQHDTHANRERHDVQQAIAEDLPELLRVYTGSPQHDEAQQHFLQQLFLIEQRMSEIVTERRSLNHGQLQAHGYYLRDKYQGQPEPTPAVAPDYSSPLREPVAAPTGKRKRSELDLD